MRELRCHERSLLARRTRTGFRPPAVGVAARCNPDLEGREYPGTLVPMRKLFSFPNPVNEVAARTVAAGVVLLSLATVVTQWSWLLVLLAYGFVARVLTGPTLSPLGQLATRVIVPALPFPPKPVDGPPKRFAQGIGASLSLVATVLWFGFDQHLAASVLVAAITAAAFLESAFAFCLGCRIFGLFSRVGVIPESACAECADLSLRPRRVGAGTAA